MRPIAAMLCASFLLLSPLSSMAAPIVGVSTQVAGFVGEAEQGPLDTPVHVDTYAEFLEIFGGSTVGLGNPHLAPSVAAYFAAGGDELYVVRVAGGSDAAWIGVDGGVPGSRTGLAALHDVDEVSMVAAPGNTSVVVQLAAIAHCELAGDRIAVLDCDLGDDPAKALTRRSLLGSSQGFATLYYPWVQAAPAGVSTWMPPSGFVCGRYAQTDAHRSPIGAIPTASAVDYPLNTSEQDQLNTNGVNAIRFFPGQGVLVWGARTLSSDPEWRYVPVRRTASYLEESVYEGTEWALSQTNDALLWAQLEADVDSFLFSHYAAGWFAGSSPNEAYFARCDFSTMTQLDLDEGRTVVLLGFAPLAPAEFMILRVEHEREDPTAVPAGLSAGVQFEARPNPFNPSTRLEFRLARPTRASLKVYDAAGRLVESLRESQEWAAGEHALQWTPRGRASGLYLAVLAGPWGRETQRLVLVK